MSKKYSKAKHIVIFILVQLAWLAVLGLWIARYIRNHMVLKEIDQRYAIHISTGGNVVILIIGLALITITTAGMWILFRYLNFHFHQTRLYDNFIASITHELRTPLASIQLYLETLDSYKDISESEWSSFLEKMHTETVRLNKMISSILEVGKLESNAAVHNYRLSEVCKIFPPMINDLMSQYQLTDDQYSISCNSDSQMVLDQAALRLVFENLIDNSLKYSSSKLSIDIAINDLPRHVQIQYRDNGSGVPQRQLNKIFRKFYRFTDNQNSSAKGTGLGLYLVKGIINHHGGKITSVIPENQTGLQFNIRFPRYPLHKKHYLERLLKSG